MGQTDPLRCFVISPIGADASDTRRHADTVYSCLIKPACEDFFDQGGAKYFPERGDHKTAPGKITDQIYEDILKVDLIVAVPTETSPNVYYELAIAQSAAKPVILLLEKGFAAPFDIKDQRIIYYDFDPQSIFHGNYAKLLRSAMNAVAENPRRPTVPFAPHLVPLGDPVQTIGDRASDGEFDTIDLIGSARRYIYMMGYTLNGWLMNESFKTAIERAGQIAADATARNTSLNVHILLMDGTNPSLPGSMKTSTVVEQVQTTAQVIRRDWSSYLSGVKGVKPDVRGLEKHNLGYQTVITEAAAISIPYLVSRDSVRSPFIFAKRDSAYFEAMKEEFAFLWDNASSKSSKRLKKKT